MPAPPPEDDFSTLEVARLFGMSVRAVQMMVDRGDLQAWKTPGGHRRIARVSVEAWRAARQLGPRAVTLGNGAATAAAQAVPSKGEGPTAPRVLLIDDSLHFQKLVAMLIRQRFPEVDLQVADDGIAGLALYGKVQPQVLIVDILLPGIDGATLITSLRSHPQFAQSHLVVVTMLDEAQRAPYRFALGQVPVIHKPQLVDELPPLLARWLGGPRQRQRARAG